MFDYRPKKTSDSKESVYLSLLPVPVALFDVSGALVAANPLATGLYQGENGHRDNKWKAQKLGKSTPGY